MIPVVRFRQRRRDRRGGRSVPHAAVRAAAIGPARSGRAGLQCLLKSCEHWHLRRSETRAARWSRRPAQQSATPRVARLANRREDLERCRGPLSLDDVHLGLPCPSASAGGLRGEALAGLPPGRQRRGKTRDSGAPTRSPRHIWHADPVVALYGSLISVQPSHAVRRAGARFDWPRGPTSS